MDMIEILSPLINRASTLPTNPDDYYKGGVLICGKCHTPKQFEIVPGVFARCLCDCEEREREKSEEEKERKQWEAITREWVSGYENMTVDRDIGTAPMRAAKKIIENWEEIRYHGLGIALYGGTGTGKTFAAAAIANAVIKKGYRAWMATASKMVDMYMVDKDIVESRLRHFDLVVIDDLGAQRETEYAGQRIYDILDTRFNSGLPTIITTNIDLGKPSNDRIYSRIIGACSKYRITGEDMRMRDADKRKKLLEDIFNAE